MKFLALDLGEKTIGMAVSDELGLTAQGLSTWYRSSLDKDLGEIERVIRERGIIRVIVGLPLNMDGSEGTKAREAQRFMEELRKKFGAAIPVEPWDERLSTMAAERNLLEADLSRAKRRKVINKMSAVFILQGYMDWFKGQEG